MYLEDRRPSLPGRGGDKVVTDGALDVLVHQLRRKLSFDAIQNVRAYGYMIPRDPQ